MEPLTYSQIVTAAIALLAVIVSFRVQRQQLRLQQKQEELTNLQIAERRVPVKAELSNDALVLRPFMSDQDINNVTIHFPRKLGIVPISLVAPDLRLEYNRIARPIKEFWDSHTPSDAANVKVRENVPIPLVIEVHGHTKGTAVVSGAFYDLYSRYVRQPSGSSQLTIKGLSLNNYLPSFVDASEALDEALENLESVVSAVSR